MTFLDVKNWAIDSIPALVRGTRLVALMTAFIDTIQSRFWLFSASVRLDLRQNGQVLNLEKGFNDRFDPFLRRIYIDDSTDAGIAPIVLYNLPESNPSWTLYNRGESGIVQVLYSASDTVTAHFLIFSPVEIEDTQIRDLVQKIPLGQRKYKIILI